MFTKAEREQAKLRLCISGPSGSGKTLGALNLADAIKGKGRIAVIDTENGSASLYADKFDFDVLNLEPPYSPTRFIEAIHEAENAAYAVIVVDSATHEWDGAGGCLEINETTARAKFKGNTWSAWSDTTKEHQKFIDAIVHSPCHVICTARSKTETAQTVDGGKKNVVRLGTKLVQRDNFEYEFTLALDLVHDGHFANAIKDRTGLFMDQTPHPITNETGEKLLSWLSSGINIDELNQKRLRKFVKLIQDSGDMEILKGVYNEAHGWAKTAGDEYLNQIVSEKEKAKDRLSEPDHPGDAAEVDDFFDEAANG